MDGWQDVFAVAPGLVMVGFVCWLFLSHMKLRDEAFTSALDKVQSQHLMACQENSEAITKNTEVMIRVSLQLGRSEKAADSLIKTVGNLERRANV